MRSDMAKILVERPRQNSGYGRKGRRANHRDLDDLPVRAPLRDRNDRTKHLNENLQPLVRYLQRQVGRPWDKVRSEMSKHIRLNNAVQKHILDHVKDYVVEHVVLQDGVPYTIARYGGGYKPVTGLYVCPRSKLLKKAKPLKKKQVTLRVHHLGPGHAVVHLRGCWHEVLLKTLYKNTTGTVYATASGDHWDWIDVVLGKVWGDEQLAVWGEINEHPQYAASVRALTHAEIRMLPISL